MTRHWCVKGGDGGCGLSSFSLVTRCWKPAGPRELALARWASKSAETGKFYGNNESL